MKNLDIAHKHYVRYHVHDVQSPLFGETVHKSLSEELAAMKPQLFERDEDFAIGNVLLKCHDFKVILVIEYAYFGANRYMY